MHLSAKILAGLAVAMAFSSSAIAGGLYVETIHAPVRRVVPELERALTAHHFKVVMHLDVLRKLCTA